LNSLSGLYLSAAGMQAQQARLDLASQNLANAGTPGYKQIASALAAMPAAGVDRVNYAAGDRSVPLGDLSQAPYTDVAAARLEPGPLESTGQSLDVAIDGDGLFVVQAPDGLRYTRRGDFHLDAGGRLVSSEGYPVLVNGAPAGRPGAALTIDGAGVVRVDGAAAGRLDVIDLAQAGPLRRAGSGYWVSAGTGPTAAGGPGLPAPGSGLATPAAAGAGDLLPARTPSGGYRLRVGSLEQANVDPLREMVSLMTAVRSYETNQKVLQTQDETLGRAVSDLGRV